ncbi:MAG: T9SS type A sorting domain-containing protein [Saprospiraceae bacterium]|nr:T9SS type A sorting domain-containing protein [Saprospiraceae bacterium]
MKTKFFIFFVLVVNYTHGQSLERYVIGSFGNFSSTTAGTTLSSTLGEIVGTTESSHSAIITQGFQQPDPLTITSIFNPKQYNLDIDVFPNPTTQYVTIKKDNLMCLYGELTNPLGQIIDSYIFKQKITQINLKSITPGTYFLSIKSTNNQFIQSFKIQKSQ